jgi:uncharacterized protein YbjT (DUF2867 family)
MAEHSTIVVTGATGRVGGQVLAQLAGTGAGVRAVARDPARLTAVAARHGARPFAADLTDPDSLGPALDGADAVFLVFPSVVGDPAAERSVAVLAERARRIVYLSAFGVPDSGPAPTDGIMGSHALLERAIATSAREWTFLRSAGFAANTLAWAAQTRGGGTEVRWFGPGITRALVHEADLAAVGVRALLEDGHQGARHHLTGPQQLTQAEQLATIGAALGRPLRFVELEAAAAGAQLFPGLPPAVASRIVADQLAMAGTAEPMTGEVQRLLGRPARAYAGWVADHRDEFD